MKLLYTLFALNVLMSVFGDRLKKETRCGRLAQDPKSLIVYTTYEGSFVDFYSNIDEQVFGSAPKNPKKEFEKGKDEGTVHGNQKVDVEEMGKPNKDALGQEGRSFCLSGEHFLNTPELSDHPNFAGMKELAEYYFDIGSHIDPYDQRLMNTFNWKLYNKPSNLPKVPAALQVQMIDGNNGSPLPEKVYQWEPTTPTFYHTRLTKNPEIPPREDLEAKGKKIPGFRTRSAEVDAQPHPDCENPYFIDVTEIDANGVRLFNWLHVTVYVKRDNIVNKKNCATGKMRYIMLEVRDALGIPVGDFSGDVECGKSCKCKSSKCKMIKDVPYNAMPCMITPLQSITQPGLFMYSASKGDYFDEVHVHWHFSQQTSYFAYELHFAALIVEDPKAVQYYNGRRTEYKNPLYCLAHHQTNDHPHLCPRTKIDKTSDHYYSAAGGATIKDVQNQYLMDWIFSEEPMGHTKYYTYRDCNRPYDSYNAYHNQQLNDIANHDKYLVDSTYFSTFASKQQQKHKPKGYFSFTMQHLSGEERVRPYGFTAQYKKLLPTIQTLGGWDLFNKKYHQVNRMNCHMKLKQDFFEETEFKGSMIPHRSGLFQWIQSYDVYKADTVNPKGIGNDTIHNRETAETKARNDSSDWVTPYMSQPLNTEFGDTSKSTNPNATFLVPKFYFGTQFTRADYETYESNMPKEIKEALKNRDDMAKIAQMERCGCQGVATTQDPATATRTVQALQGRRSHAIQMLLAWVVLVPVALFVIRYYKETYARVFFLQEFWWYTVHFLCLATAWILMIGGIYAIEVKRISGEVYYTSPEGWAHIIMGSVVIGIFTIHLILAPFRIWPVKWRVIQIIFHFTFGMMEYALAVATIMIAAAIPQGRLSCSAFYTYIAFLVFQVILYILMEIHMRYVDRLLDLYPPRTYLPPPVVRLFHTNAPMSKFRVYLLIVYLVICWIFFHVLQHLVTKDIASCFIDNNNDYEEDAY